MCKSCQEFRRWMEQQDQIEGATIAVGLFGTGFTTGVVFASLVAWVW